MKMTMLPPLKVYPFNPLFTGGFFHYYMLDETICHFRGVRSTLSLFVLFLKINPVSKQCRP